MKTLYGITTAMTTPFTAEGEVDLEALARQTEFLIQAGVSCLYPCGTTGEMMLMTAEQRKQAAACVVKTNAGRLPVFIHVGALRTADTLELARHAADIGADGIGVITPSFYHLSDEEMIHYYTAIARAVPSDFPMYLYNIPQCTVNDLSPAACAETARQCPNVIGVKYSYADLHRTLEYLQVRNHQFHVMVGFDRLLVPALTMGCDGVVSGVSSVFPEPFVALYRAYQEQNQAEMQRLMWLCNDLVVRLKAGSRLEVFKAAQTMRGLPGGHVLSPLLDLSETEKETLQKELQPYLEAWPLS